MSDILFIIDNSISTFLCAELYIKTINMIIETQKRLAPDSLLSLVTFNDKIRYHYIRKRVADIEPLTKAKFDSQGMTALYDSVTNILHKVMNFQKNINCNPPLCIILTDGEDNSSRRIDARLCAIQIEFAKASGYHIVFLGTTEPAVKKGKMIGCQTCILYELTKSSLERVIQSITHIYKNPTQNFDLDLRDITMLFENMSISK